ncbi:hypothetical protein [Paenibacillus sp.]|uniref:hypothetical protein n=1 Tax=Paenibacillus sp. TaxID=58172 RepID=UPI002D49B33B|nr:hypothetical protein [Paenibacillus sp.]HZG83843.1 hypothetical protein [Paenibacillus sp.]
MSSRQVRIVLDARGFGKVFVDDMDLSAHVQAIEVRAVAGSEMGIRLQLVPKSVSIEAEMKEIEPTEDGWRQFVRA